MSQRPLDYASSTTPEHASMSRRALAICHLLLVCGIIGAIVIGATAVLVLTAIGFIFGAAAALSLVVAVVILGNWLSRRIIRQQSKATR